MKVVVEDANVLLDLVNGGVLGLWLGFNYEHVTTHLVWGEVTDEAQRAQIQPLIDAGNLTLREISPGDWEQLSAFSESTGVSIPDSSVWCIARAEKAILLTGDGTLRKAASSDVEVRGILWVLEQLITAEKIAGVEACRALDLIRSHGAFLPPAACRAFREKWNSSSPDGER